MLAPRSLKKSLVLAGAVLAAATLVSGVLVAESTNHGAKSPLDRVTLDQTTVTQRLDVVKEILEDESVPADKRIQEALAKLDDARGQLEAEAMARNNQLSTDPGNQDPFAALMNPGTGGSFFANDPFFSGGGDPFARMRDMQTMTDQLFRQAMPSAGGGLPQTGLRGFNQSFTPDADVKEETDAFVVTMDLPGMDSSEVNVEVHNGQLTVSGQREVQNQDKDSNGNILRQERSVGSFMRSIPLPGPVKEGDIEAKQENGVLTIRLPKADPAQPHGKRIVVK